jgi:hypothetical protein
MFRSVIAVTFTNRLLVRCRGTRCLGLLLVLIVIMGAKGSPGERNPGAANPALLIERASQNEVRELETPTPYQQYFERLEWKWGTETRAVIETQEGRADRIVKFNGEPLAPDQQARQIHRLEKLLSDGKARKEEFKEQRSELRRRVRMMAAFPKAFLFAPDGDGPDGTLRFSFRPNPKFSPHDRETQVFRGMEGTVWVNPAEERLTRIEGVLTKDVSFGWGIFGKLYKGGTYEIAQKQISPGVWRITRLDLNLRARVFLGGFHLLRNEQNEGFEPTPKEMTYEEALELLLKSPPGRPETGYPAGPVR